MKGCFIVILIVLFQYKLLAQKGLPIRLEVGFAHNTMTWKTKYDGPFSIDDTTFKRKELFFTPAIRAAYEVVGWKLSEKVLFNLSPFIGYHAFGGRSSEEENGYKDKFIFNAIEGGAFAQFDFDDKIVIAPAIVGKYILSAKSKSYGSFLDPPGTVRTWSSRDVDELYKDFSMSAGLAMRYKVKTISFGVETWFGITNLFKLDGDFVEIKVHENNYRFMIGIEL